MATRAELRARIAALEAQVADLQAEVTRLNGVIAGLRATNTTLRSDITTKNAQIASLESRISELNAEIQRLETRVAELEGTVSSQQAEIAGKNAQIADLTAEVKRLTDLYEPENPPEPPAGSTLMGVTVTGGVRKNMPDLHDDVQISRVFAAGATSWANEGQHKAFPNGKWACSNSYSLSEANLPKMLASIPDADKAKIMAWADGHELEHPDKNLNPADVKARMRRTAQVIRDAGLKVASCVMGFSIKDDEWLRWIDPDVVDYICFDKYNSGAKKTPPIYQDPVSMVGEAKNQSIRFGKPFGFWETGTNNFEQDAWTDAEKAAERQKRVAWTKALRAEMNKQKGVCAIWFDRPSTSGSDWDATLDRPTAEAWLL